MSLLLWLSLPSRGCYSIFDILIPNLQSHLSTVKKSLSSLSTSFFLNRPPIDFAIFPNFPSLPYMHKKKVYLAVESNGSLHFVIIVLYNECAHIVQYSVSVYKTSNAPISHVPSIHFRLLEGVHSSIIKFYNILPNSQSLQGIYSIQSCNYFSMPMHSVPFPFKQIV